MNKDLNKPDGLDKLGTLAHKTIIKFLTKSDLTNTGGCKAFYSPEEWKERGEDYGTNSKLVIVHDGGSLASVFNLDYEQYELNESMNQELIRHGLFVEQCTSWYSAVYEI
jgi:hypothetical protein